MACRGSRPANSLIKAARLGPQAWIDLARAVLELAIANRKLGARTAGELLTSAGNAAALVGDQSLSGRQARLVSRVAFAIPRMAARMPWRSDCLVQALAAQRWLRRNHIATALTIGVIKEPDSEFAAHAWLKVGDAIVTGGDITGFEPLVAAGPGLPPPAKLAR